MVHTRITQSSLPHQHGERIGHVLEHMPETEDFKTVADIFKQLGDSSRIRIFWLLCHCEECVMNISAIVDMTSPAVSHHLKILKASGLIESRRTGKEVYYRAADTPAAQLLHQMIEQLVAITCPAGYTDEDLFLYNGETTHTPEYEEEHIQSPAGQKRLRMVGDGECETQGHKTKEHAARQRDMSDRTDEGRTSALRETPEGRLSEQEETIVEIHDYLINHLQQRITIDELARDYLINTSTLKEVFKKVYGKPLAAYVREYRMNTAAQLLVDSQESITEIARRVGYESPSKFTQAFREVYQCSPSAYRRDRRH